MAPPGDPKGPSLSPDLVAGSGARIDDRGTREFSGVLGEWRIWAVTS
jgi:hypothetical protein